MPMKPKVPCKHPGCAALIPSGQKYCDRHKVMHPEEIRPAAGRGYTAAWRRASKAFLRDVQPLCRQCLKEGRYTKATVVDHIVPHRGNSKLFWDRNNWQGLCKRCHDRKTMTTERYQEYRYQRYLSQRKYKRVITLHNPPIIENTSAKLIVGPPYYQFCQHNRNETCSGKGIDTH